jgi:hypothetical protein
MRDNKINNNFSLVDKKKIITYVTQIKQHNFKYQEKNYIILNKY